MMGPMAGEETRALASTTTGDTPAGSRPVPPSRTRGPAPSPRPHGWTARLLVVAVILAALNLRPAITSLGALLEEVRVALGMSGSVAGLLTSVPPLCFAVFGVTAPRLARRFGPGAVVCGGMAAIAAGLLVRPFAGGTAGFLAGTALALMGIAVSNVLMPVIVKRWFPDRIGSMTGLYSMALALGTSTAAAVTVPATGLLGGHWRSGLVLWSALAAVAVLPWLAFVRGGDADTDGGRGRGRGVGGADTSGGRGRGRAVGGAPGEAGAAGVAAESGAAPGGAVSAGAGATGAVSAGETPAGQAHASVPGPGAPAPVPGPRAEAAPPRISRSPTAWALACFFGLQATAAYITMGWMPQIFRDAGVPAGTAGLLLAVTMVMGVPLAFVIPRLATRLPHQGPIVLVLGASGLAGYAGLHFAPAAGAWAWALLLGIAGCAFPLALTLVGMRARTGSGVAQLSAFAQSTGYLISIPGPLLVGVLYQHSGGWGLPIGLMAALLVPQTVFGYLAGRPRTVEEETAR
ncbi:CynX/NimT family MFS transporter [Streptomyces sp. bgisy022]|uniref:CynX/NimT family MFS transporter n=1 Tax=Streptomyces sp. bgisy022 TaxID=3413769 RepID=UPI003D71E4AD